VTIAAEEDAMAAGSRRGRSGEGTGVGDTARTGRRVASVCLFGLALVLGGAGAGAVGD
jgi:hypothetical protein